jgi:hypothetical protein
MSKLVDLDVIIHHETDKAYLVSDTGNKDDAKWVPKSQCEFVPLREDSKVGLLTMEERTAIEKGFV